MRRTKRVIRYFSWIRFGLLVLIAISLVWLVFFSGYFFKKNGIAFEVKRGSKPISLTSKEFSLLEFLARLQALKSGYCAQLPLDIARA